MKRTSDFRKLIIILIFMGLILPVHAAEMYKWVDKEGFVHLSDEQLEGTEEITRIRIDDPDQIYIENCLN